MTTTVSFEKKRNKRKGTGQEASFPVYTIELRRRGWYECVSDALIARFFLSDLKDPRNVKTEAI